MKYRRNNMFMSDGDVAMYENRRLDTVEDQNSGLRVRLFDIRIVCQIIVIRDVVTVSIQNQIISTNDQNISRNKYSSIGLYVKSLI